MVRLPLTLRRSLVREPALSFRTVVPARLTLLLTVRVPRAEVVPGETRVPAAETRLPLRVPLPDKAWPLVALRVNVAVLRTETSTEPPLRTMLVLLLMEPLSDRTRVPPAMTVLP